jgi:hypothetical protein
MRTFLLSVAIACLVLVAAMVGLALVDPDNAPDLATNGDAIFLIVVPLALVPIVAPFWILWDASRRGVRNPFMWCVLAIIFHWFGLIGYLMCRPHGRVVRCWNCGHGRMEWARYCPTCHQR